MRRWLPWVAVAALLLWQKSCADRAQGALQAELRASHEREQQLAERGVRVDSVFVVDTLRLDKWRGKYAALRDSLLHLQPGDSNKDALTVVVLNSADSTIHACSVALLTCEQRVAVRDSLLANLRQQLTLEKRKRPGLFAHLGRSAALLGAGFVAGTVLAR